jgi:hypothetical protein
MSLARFQVKNVLRGRRDDIHDVARPPIQGIALLFKVCMPIVGLDQLVLLMI